MIHYIGRSRPAMSRYLPLFSCAMSWTVESGKFNSLAQPWLARVADFSHPRMSWYWTQSAMQRNAMIRDAMERVIGSVHVRTYLARLTLTPVFAKQTPIAGYTYIWRHAFRHAFCMVFCISLYIYIYIYLSCPKRAFATFPVCGFTLSVLKRFENV